VCLYVSWSFAVQARVPLQKGCGEKGIIKIEYNGCLISVFELVLGAVLDEGLFAAPLCSGSICRMIEDSLQSFERIELGI
jgi:hypothetical protein